jgi:hypothetical protein
LAAGQRLREAGVRLYAIGLGADVDAATLVLIAGGGARYRFAPDETTLAGIYAEVARDIQCPPERLWPSTQPGQLALHDVQVGPADPAGRHVDDNVARAGQRRRHLGHRRRVDLHRRRPRGDDGAHRPSRSRGRTGRQRHALADQPIAIRRSIAAR